MGALKEQRRTWNAYFDRQKEDEAETDTDEMETTVVVNPGHHQSSLSTKKSPRKSVSNSEDRIKVGLLEQQIQELKERNEEDSEEFKSKVFFDVF